MNFKWKSLDVKFALGLSNREQRDWDGDRDMKSHPGKISVAGGGQNEATAVSPLRSLSLKVQDLRIHPFQQGLLCQGIRPGPTTINLDTIGKFLVKMFYWDF